MNNLFLTAINEHNCGRTAKLNHIHRSIEIELERIRSSIINAGFWYIDIPRTSSTLIKINLGKKWGYPFGKNNNIEQTSSFLSDHTPAYIVQEMLGEVIWPSIRTLSIVRNPYDWTLSLWRYTKNYYHLGFSGESFTDFLFELDRNCSSPLDMRTVYPSNHLQSDYIFDPERKLLVKEVFNFEQREAIFDLLKSLNVKDPDTTVLMKSDSSSYKLDEKEKKLVRKVCAKDFELLGY